MREWLTDEERAEQDRNAWKCEVEAGLIVVLMLISLVSVVLG